MSKRVSISAPLIGLVAMLAFVGVAANASAGIDTLPETVAAALGISEDAGKMMVGVMIMVSVGLCLALADANVIVDAIVLIAVLGLLVLIGWLYAWLLVVVIILIIAMFARDPMAEWFSRSAGS